MEPRTGRPPRLGLSVLKVSLPRHGPRAPRFWLARRSRRRLGLTDDGSKEAHRAHG
jgi:hypothetical protein